MENSIEKRLYIDVKYRAITEGNDKYIEGYASVFNRQSKLLYENNKFFYEIIKPNAFDNVLKSNNLNVILNYQHNDTNILARLTVVNGEIIQNTLSLNTDDYGLRFRAKLPNTQLGNDIYELVNAGILYECSFAFSPNYENIVTYYNDNGDFITEINDIIYLGDVSVVVTGAYSKTDVKITTRELKKYFDIEENKEVKEEVKEENIERKVDNSNIIRLLANNLE